MQKHKIQNIKPSEYSGIVYNLEVADDNSYVANNIVVHNCDPVTGAKREFSTNLFQYVDFDFVKTLDTLCFITIDPAVSKQDSSDYTGFTINWVSLENKWYIKAWREKINSAELFDKLFLLYKQYKPDSIGIEKTAFTIALKPFLDEEMRKRNMFLPIKELIHGGQKKEFRIRGLLPRYESGSIFHIKGECQDLEGELLRFPHSRHDDTSDSMAYQAQIAQAPFVYKKDEEEEYSMMYSDIGL